MIQLYFTINSTCASKIHLSRTLALDEQIVEFVFTIITTKMAISQNQNHHGRWCPGNILPDLDQGIRGHEWSKTQVSRKCEQADFGQRTFLKKECCPMYYLNFTLVLLMPQAGNLLKPDLELTV